RAVAQSVRTIGLRIDERAALARREAEAVLEEDHALDPREIVRERQQDDVERALHQLLVQLLRDVLVQKQLEAGKRAADVRQDARQQERRDRRDHAEVQRPLERTVL